MESLAQLNADFWLITFSVLLLTSWILAIAALWVFFRAGRDLHRIADALTSARAWRDALDPDAMHITFERGRARAGVANSAFGR